MPPCPRRPRVLLLHYDFAFVEHGPLPPHERTWRHPSELAAEQHARARSETAGPTTRVFAFTTGTLGLLAVGMLVLAVTPGRSPAPVAISATTSPAGVDVTSVAIVTTIVSAPERTPIGLRGRPEALATPIGEGRLAVVTAADLAATTGASDVGTSVEVAVPSGRMHDALVVARAGDTVVVRLERAEPGVTLADEQPAGHEIVTVLAAPPVTIVFDDLASLDVEEGTAVLDDTGELIGLCSVGVHDELRLVRIDDQLLATDQAIDQDRDDRDTGSDDDRHGTDPAATPDVADPDSMPVSTSHVAVDPTPADGDPPVDDGLPDPVSPERPGERPLAGSSDGATSGG